MKLYVVMNKTNNTPLTAFPSQKEAEDWIKATFEVKVFEDQTEKKNA